MYKKLKNPHQYHYSIDRQGTGHLRVNLIFFIVVLASSMIQVQHIVSMRREEKKETVNEISYVSDAIFIY